MSGNSRYPKSKSAVEAIDAALRQPDDEAVERAEMFFIEYKYVNS